MRIAVTGGSGFIGAATCRELEAKGHEAVVIDRVNGTDILDRKAVDRALEDCGAVIHLAGVLGTEELFADPFNAVDVNINGTLNILMSLEERKGQFVGITMPQVWDNVYQATKNCAQRLSYAWMRHRGVPVSHVRAYNAFGPGQHVHGVQKIIPTFATRAWRGERIPVWGDGTQTVDLVFVDDLARLLVRALDFGDGEVFDGATGIDFSVNEVVAMVLDSVYDDSPMAPKVGMPSTIQYLPMRAGEHPVELHAEGEGWDLLDSSDLPAFRPYDLDQTVDWYKADRP